MNLTPFAADQQRNWLVKGREVCTMKREGTKNNPICTDNGADFLISFLFNLFSLSLLSTHLYMHTLIIMAASQWFPFQLKLFPLEKIKIAGNCCVHGIIICVFMTYVGSSFASSDTGQRFIYLKYHIPPLHRESTHLHREHTLPNNF